MKTPYIDGLIPLHETADDTLCRLSANIGSLTAFIDDAEQHGLYYLATMFDRARSVKAAQAKGIIALVTAGSENQPGAIPAPVGS